MRGRRVGRARRREAGHVFFLALLTPSVLSRLFVVRCAFFNIICFLLPVWATYIAGGLERAVSIHLLRTQAVPCSLHAL